MLLDRRHRLLPVPRYRTRVRCLAFTSVLLPLAALGQSRDGSAVVEEILVTARKIAEDLSRVPMSVQPLSGEFLDRRGLSSLYDLQFEVPGLVATSAGMFGAGIALRGVTDAGGGSLAVAPHINGIYLGRSNLALARLFDVERIEVVKGPQGTLYGRNATGGAINVITRGPEDEFGAAVEGAVGSFNTVRVRGHVNFASERVGARLAVAGSDGDGFIRNSVDDRRFAEEDYAAVRASLRARPSAALTIDLTAHRVEDDGAMGELWLPRKDYLPDPNDIRLTTVTLDDPYLSSSNDFGALDIVYELEDLILRSITGYALNVTHALDDCAGTPQLRGCVRGVRPLRYAQRSQELRLESFADESFAWLAGIFYFDADENTNTHLRAPLLASVPISDLSAAADETAYAVFGDATHALGTRWRLSGGLRLSREEHRVADVGNGTTDNRTLTTADGSWHDTSWRLGFEFASAEHMLVYANVSTGFKSGGVTTELLPNGEFDGFDPEKLLAYEAGVNAILAGRRSTVRGSAFLYDFEDMQVRTTVVLDNRVMSVVDNAAAARIYGLDLSATSRVSERVTFSGALVWMPTREFVEFTDALSGDLLSGNVVSRAPEWSASASIRYRIPTGRVGELSVDVDYNYRSEIFFTRENDPVIAQDGVSLLNVVLRFDSLRGRWYAFASARNLLDTDYFNQVLLQSSPGYPANHVVGFGLKF
jgi:iron complex outermembrane receptor protein